jgi:cytochrome c oxidase subunit 4
MSATQMQSPLQGPLHETRDGHPNDYGDGHGHMGHLSTPRSLLIVFGSLLVLTVITVWVSRGPVDFGWLSLLVAMVIATVKAMLVMLFFMHLSHDKKFNMLLFFSGYGFLALFLFFALLDSGQYQRDVQDWKLANPPASAATAPAPAAGS